jgi:hypothetical protein
MRNLAIDSNIFNHMYHFLTYIIIQPEDGWNKEPKHVAGNNNVKYTINPNNNH